jgi:hypothetical protein
VGSLRLSLMSTPRRADGDGMTGTEQGWYPDPGAQADLRWWDGLTWTSHTRARPPEPPVAASVLSTAPPPPMMARTAVASAPEPPRAAPGSFTDWGQNGIAPVGTLVRGPAPSRSRSSSRSWQSWALIGVAVAVVVAVILFLAVSLLGTKDTSSSRSLGGAGGINSGVAQSTTTLPSQAAPGSKSPTRTAPPSTTPGSGSSPGGAKASTFSDPDGVYTMSIDPSWVAGAPSNGRVWTVPGPSADQPWATVDITKEALAAPISLSDYTQRQLTLLAAFPAFKVNSNSSTTLADGTAATVINYTTELVAGSPLEGTVTFTVKGLHAVAVTLATTGNAPPSVTPSALAYIHTLHLN